MAFPPTSRTYARNPAWPLRSIRHPSLSTPWPEKAEKDGWIPSALHLALHGGEDYELLFTASRRTKIPAKIAGVPIHAIGRMKKHRKGKALIEMAGYRRQTHVARCWRLGAFPLDLIESDETSLHLQQKPPSESYCRSNLLSSWTDSKRCLPEQVLMPTIRSH